MRNYKKVFISIIGVLFVAGIIVLATAQRGDFSGVKIGLILPLTGDAASVGGSAKNAALLAQKSFGTTNRMYELLFEDDQADAKKTVSAYQKLHTTDNVKAVVAAFSGPSNAIAPLGEVDGVITFTIASDMTVAKNKSFVFNHWIKPENEAKVYIAEAQRRGLKRVAMFATNQQGVIAVRDALLRENPDLFLLTSDLISENDKDFRTLILKAKEQNIDSFILLLLPGQFATAVKQIHEAGFDVPITGIESFEYDQEVLPLLEGQWYINADDPNEEFVKQYQEEYNSLPQIAAGNTYDIVRLLITSFEKAGDDLEKVVGALSQTKDFSGAMGRLSVDPDGNIDSQAVVKEIRNGKFVKAAR